MYKTCLEAKARFLRQFGLNDTDKVIEYLNEHMVNVSKANVDVRLDNLANTMISNRLNGDKTFVKVKGE